MTDSSDFNDLDIPEEELKPDEPEVEVEDQEARIPLVWQIVVVVISAVIVLALLWPTISRRLSSNSPAPGGPAQSAAPDSSGQPFSTLPPDIASGPEAVAAYFKLGNDYADEGQWQAAIESYQKVLELDPDYLDAYANLGVAYYQLQQLDKALEAYQQALALNPDDADVNYNLGALYLQQALSVSSLPDQREIRRAIDQINKALELKPDLAPPHFSLGVAYMALGDTAQAITEFERFQALDDGQDQQATQLAEQYLTQLRIGTGQ